MSYGYYFYAGYLKNDKIYPLGPYNDKGELRYILYRSSSFASDLHERFYEISDGMVSDELRSKFESTDIFGRKCVSVKYLPISEMPSGSYIKTGYFLIDSVKNYEETHDEDDIKYDGITPTVYAGMLDKELKFGKNKEEKDIEGNTYLPPSASDYMFYAYPSYGSEEYEAELISTVASHLMSWPDSEECTLVALMTEG